MGSKYIYDMSIDELWQCLERLRRDYPVPNALLYIQLQYENASRINTTKSKAMVKSLRKSFSQLGHVFDYDIENDKVNLKRLAMEYGYSYGYIRKVSCKGKWKIKRKIYRMIIHKTTVKKTQEKILMQRSVKQ